jgi:hypothetical protein
MMRKSLVVMVVALSIISSGCASSGRNRYGTYDRVTYNDVNTVYGTNEPVYMSHEELAKYNGIRIGSDGYVKSLVQIPKVKCSEMPHYTYTPPPSFRASYERERDCK